MRVPASSTTFGRTSGSITSVYQSSDVASGYGLFQNDPDPFNPTPALRYQLPRTGVVHLIVCGLFGREVAGLATTL